MKIINKLETRYIVQDDSLKTNTRFKFSKIFVINTIFINMSFYFKFCF